MAGLYQPFKDLSLTLSETYRIFPENELTKGERYILKALESFNCWDGRVISIGTSGTARAWTDGSNFIALDRHFLDECMNYGDIGLARLVNVLTHEMAHDSSSIGSHVHGETFYRRFHDLCVRENKPIQHILTRFADRLSKSKIVGNKEEVEARQKREIKRREKMLAADAG